MMTMMKAKTMTMTTTTTDSSGGRRRRRRRLLVQYDPQVDPPPTVDSVVDIGELIDSLLGISLLADLICGWVDRGIDGQMKIDGQMNCRRGSDNARIYHSLSSIVLTSFHNYLPSV